MRTAIIFFEGKEVCKVECDEIKSFESICFLKEGEEVACFPINYGYVILQ